MLYRFLRLLTILFAKLLFRLEVRGREFVPSHGAFILASNHLSYLDPPMLGVASPRILHFMASASLFNDPGFGWVIRHLNAFPLRRDEQDPASIRLALQHLRQGRALVVFPEGGRSRTGQLGKARPGIGLLAAHAKVPVVPVYLSGTDKALPRQARIIRLHKISVHFGKPLFFKGRPSSKGDRRASYQAFSEEVMASLCEIKALTI